MRYAGQSTRKMAAQRRSLGLVLVLLALIAALAIIPLSSTLEMWGISSAGILLVIICVRIAIKVLESNAARQFKAEDRAIRGARAEETIEALLQELGEDFCVLHDVSSPYGNIDHVVVSKRNGVFLIETKAHGGKVAVTKDSLLVNGKPPEKDFVAQTLRNTYWLKEALRRMTGADVWVTPIVVFANAFTPPSKPVKGVFIMNKRLLLGAIRRGRSGSAGPAIWEKRKEIALALTADSSAMDGVPSLPPG